MRYVKSFRRTLFVALLAVSAFAVAGCDNPNVGGADPSNKAQTEATASENSSAAITIAEPRPPAPPQAPKPGQSTAAPGAKMPKAGDKVAVIETDLGRIVLKFFPEKAPKHVKNFQDLATKGFYDGTKFHRTIPGFVIQGGDPETKKDDRSKWGTGGPGYSVEGEMNDISHTRGILSMARSQSRNSAGSQFFITVADVKSLDPGGMGEGSDGYTVFGQVVEGMHVVDAIVKAPNSGPPNNTALSPVAMKKVRIETWPLKDK